MAEAERLPTTALVEEAIVDAGSDAASTAVAAFNDEPYGDHWFEKRLD